MISTSARIAVACLTLLCAAAPASAQDFRPVTDKGAFVGLIDGRELRRFGIRLSVSPGGQISGNAFGADVRGAWSWSGQYFCRSLAYGSNTLPENCQTVAVSGNTVRFTADRGAGDTADLTLR